MKTQHQQHRAFTLVELLTVIGIIAVLLALMMPTLAAARRNAQTIVCANNIKNLGNALANYAALNKGYYPGNVGALNLYWYNRYAIGSYIKAPYEMSNSEQCIGSVIECPSDLEGAVRCYSMNIYASAFVSPYVQQALLADPPMGKLWKQGDGEGSKLILLVESFTYEDWPAENMATGIGTGITGSWSSPAVVGFVGATPASRFIAGGPDVPDRFGQCASQLCYSRHRRPKETGTLGDATGRLNIAFADGHVELLSSDDLVDRQTGLSTFRAMWSPNDREIEQAYQAQ